MIGNLMELPYWVVLSVLTLLWLLAMLIWAVGHYFAPALGSGSLVGLPMAGVFLAGAYWIALGERASRRRRLESASSLYRLGALSSIDFEEAVGELFRLQGYVVVENIHPDDEDGGVDLEIAKGGETFLVQVKKKWENVGVKEVRELWGIVAGERAQGAFFVTSKGFSDSAAEFALGKRFTLIDGESFLTLRAAAIPPSRQPKDVDPVLSDGFARHLAAQAVPECRKCQKPMVMITKVVGSKVIKQFWGCPDYPSCSDSRRAVPYLGDPVTDRSIRATNIKDRLQIARTNALRLRRRRVSETPADIVS